jgi:hypothetical protein
MPRSLLERRARRTRPLPPPGIVTFLLALWRDFNSRAALVPFLINLRRSPDHSQKLFEIILVLAQFNTAQTRDAETAAGAKDATR